MSVTATDLTNGIRVDQATQKGAMCDVGHLTCQKPGNYASQNFLRLESNRHQKGVNRESTTKVEKPQWLMLQPAWLLPRKKAFSFRRKGAESVCRMLGEDLTLMDKIQRTGGWQSRTVLLASNSHSSRQASVPELPYTPEQLQQIQAAAAAFVASNNDIQTVHSGVKRVSRGQIQPV